MGRLGTRNPNQTQTLRMNTDSESELISIIAQDPSWTRKHSHQLSTVIFGRESNRLIFDAITECGFDWDLVTITNVLRRQGTLDQVGGAAGVGELFMSFPVMSLAEHHLNAVRDVATLRRSLHLHRDAQARLEAAIAQGTGDAAGLLSQIREQLAAAGKLPGKRLDRMTSSQAVEKVVDHIEERARRSGSIAGITTGFAKLDHLTHGLQEGHLWVIAGGPSDGKSTLMQNILEGAVGVGTKTAVYQLEMPVEEQCLRFIASDGMIDSGNLLRGLMTYQEQMALVTSIKRLKDQGCSYVNTDSATADDILSDIESGDDRVVMIDYLQLLDVATSKNESREQAMSTVARKLKNLAKAKGITILTGSQLNDEGRLRESRAIGQHADKVLMVAKVEGNEARRKLIVDKNRGGPRGEVIPLAFAGASYHFSEAGEDDDHFTEEMPDQPRRKRG